MAVQTTGNYYFRSQPRSRGFFPGFSHRSAAMSDNYYSEINLHLTWHTKLSRPLLNPQIEAMAHACLREKIAQLGDIYLHEIGGTENHVRLAVTIEPTVKVSEMIGALKGYTSHEVNRRSGFGRTVLQWQVG